MHEVEQGRIRACIEDADGLGVLLFHFINVPDPNLAMR